VAELAKRLRMVERALAHEATGGLTLGAANALLARLDALREVVLGAPRAAVRR